MSVNRRDFLKTAAAGTAAAVLPFSIPDEKPKVDLRRFADALGNTRPKIEIPKIKTWIFDMEYDVTEEFRFCGGLFNERVEAWYRFLHDRIKGEYGPVKTVIAHPATIYHLMTYYPAWKDVDLTSGVPDTDVMMWKAGERVFWRGDRRALVWAYRDFATTFAGTPSNPGSHWCGDYEPPKTPKHTDVIHFFCEKGIFYMHVYWGSVNWERWGAI